MVDEFLLVADDYRHQIYQTDKNGDNVVALRFPHWDRPIGKDSFPDISDWQASWALHVKNG